MKVFVNLPELEDDKEELENRVANFHATLLIEKIKGLNINDANKRKLLDLVLKEVQDQSEFKFELALVCIYEKKSNLVAIEFRIEVCYTRCMVQIH